MDRVRVRRPPKSGEEIEGIRSPRLTETEGLGGQCGDEAREADCRSTSGQCAEITEVQLIDADA